MFHSILFLDHQTLTNERENQNFDNGNEMRTRPSSHRTDLGRQ
jgi:hypothetical protein